VKLASRLFAVMLAAFAICLSAQAQDIKTDYDHHADFSRYRTYRWEKVRTPDQLWDRRVQDAVDHALQAKGWQRVESGGDVAITAVGSTQNQQEYQTFYNGLGGWRWGGFGETTTEVQTYKTGSLVLDFYDSSNKQLLWRGISSDILSDKPEKNEKKLDKAVDKLLEKFPPQEKG
jgi:hypothetical protein